jgi:outer membrane protein assembly factor BamB
VRRWRWGALCALLGLLAVAGWAGGSVEARACLAEPADPGVVPPPGVGLAAWKTFEASGAHDPTLPGGPRPLVARWSFRAHGELVVAPSVVRGVAYFGTLAGCVYAVDVATGRPLWAFRADNEVMDQPLVVANRVYFTTGNKVIAVVAGHYIRGTGPSAAYALDAATGRLVWRTPLPAGTMPTLAYRHGVLYAATGAAQFLALDARTGRVLWRLPVSSLDSMSSPVLVRGTAVFGGTTPFGFFGVDLAARRLAWFLPMPYAAGGVDDVSPAADGDTVFVQVPLGIFPHADVEELAVDAATGHIVWQATLGRGILPTDGKEEIGVATLAGGALYVGSPALPELWALSASDGRPLWPHPARLPVGVRASPLAWGDRLYVAGSGLLMVLERTDGRLLAVRRLGTPSGLAACAPPAPEAVGDTLLVAGGHDDTLLAVPVAALG